jgi:hypothetical protein
MAKKICADFSGYTPGPLKGPRLKPHRGVSILTHPFTNARIEDRSLPVPPTQHCLGFFGTGIIQVDIPGAKQIDIYIENIGGAPLNVTFYNKNWLPILPGVSAAAGEGVKLITQVGANSIVVEVNSAECLVWKVCYLPK